MSRDNPAKLLEDPQSLNLYAYARNNPLKYVDPSGETFEEFRNKMNYGFYTTDKRIAEMERMSLNMDKSGGQYLVSPEMGKYYSNRKSDLSIGNMATCFMGTFCGEQPINPNNITPGDLSEKQLLHNRKVIADRAADFAMMVGGMSGGVRGIESVFKNPKLLLNKTPSEVTNSIGSLPQNWKLETLGKGSHKGQGMIIREYNPQGNPTDRFIQYHPGGGSHGPEPYWKVTSGKTGIIRIGSQFE